MVTFRIKEIRNKRDYTIVELAHRARMSPSYISDVERGAINPSIRALAKIAKALEVSIKDLIVETED